MPEGTSNVDAKVLRLKRHNKNTKPGMGGSALKYDNNDLSDIKLTVKFSVIHCHSF